MLGYLEHGAGVLTCDRDGGGALVGVGTRGTLAAKLFAEQYAPALHAPHAGVATVFR